eukprot:g32431.t1
MSFGEQLVLETYLRFRGRRYDRQRQEELSQPRRIKPPADHWTGGRGRKVLEKEQLDDMLKRLAEPKRGKATDSGELIAWGLGPDHATKRYAHTPLGELGELPTT